MPEIALVVATCKWDGWRECFDSWNGSNVESHLIDNSVDNIGVLPSLQLGLAVTKAPIVAFIHDDVICREKNWTERVLAAFEEPQVGVVGFGGARSHGSPDIYQVPYDYRQLGRSGYMSNVDDAEVHGSRFTGEREVAVLDGFALIARRELLDKVFGWPLETPIGYIAYDYWLCCIAHELGYKIKLVGIRCHHFGGRSAVKAEPQFRGDFDAAHEYIYKRFRNVLPWVCA